jgi:hypothetical protein
VQERNDTLDAAQSVDAIVTGAAVFNSPAAGALPQLAAGTDFTSYLLHFDPVGSDGGQMGVVSGSVTFLQDVIAVLFDDALLASSDAALGSIGNYGLAVDRGLSWGGGDVIAVSADQRTLNFSLSTPGDEMLQFRVLTATAVPSRPGTGFPDDVNFDLAGWKSSFGRDALGDADGDGDTDGADFLAWQRQVGASIAGHSAAAKVPEPASLAMLVIALAIVLAGTQRSALSARRSRSA